MRVDIERLARRLARIGAEPLGLEIIAGFRRRPLLVERRPVARELSCLLVAQELSIAISIVPQPLAGLTAEQIAGFGLGRQRNDVPVLSAALHFSDDAAGQVVLVPAGLD